MKEDHVEPRQSQQDELALEEEIAGIAGGLCREEQAAGEGRESERDPGAGEDVARKPAERAIQRSKTNEPQVDDRDRADDQSYGSTWSDSTQGNRISFSRISVASAV